MTLNKNLILCVGASLALVACAECPKTSDYDKVPYNNTRTAGEGIAVYGGNCATPEPEPAPVAEPAPAPAPEPAPIEPQPEPPVFKEQQMK